MTDVLTEAQRRFVEQERKATVKRFADDKSFDSWWLGIVDSLEARVRASDLAVETLTTGLAECEARAMRLEAECSRLRVETVRLMGERDDALDRYKPSGWFINWRTAGSTIRRLRRRWTWERRRAEKWCEDYFLMEQDAGVWQREAERSTTRVGEVLNERDAARADAARLRQERDTARMALTPCVKIDSEMLRAEIVRLTAELADQAEQDKGALDGMRAERDKYKKAMENHLCPNDLADWLACAGGHPEHHCALCSAEFHHAAGFHEACDLVDDEMVGLEVDDMFGAVGHVPLDEMKKLRARYPHPVTTAAVVYDSTRPTEYDPIDRAAALDAAQPIEDRSAGIEIADGMDDPQSERKDSTP